VDSAALQDLQAHLDFLRSEHLEALAAFTLTKGAGFARTLDDQKRERLCEASTASAVISICHAEGWDRWLEVLTPEGEEAPEEWASEKLESRLLRGEAWRSESLASTSGGAGRNPYHTARATEAAMAVGPSMELCVLDRLSVAARYLRNELGRKAEGDRSQPQNEPGSISIQFAPSAHPTHLAVRALRRIDEVVDGGHTKAIEAMCRDWAWRRMVRQVALAAAESRTADPYEMAYAAMIVASFGLSELARSDAQLVSAAIDGVFAFQTDDGLWPRSSPLLAHIYVGTEYSYEYEMLSQMLQEPELEEHLLRHVDGLARAARALETNHYDVKGVRTWSGGRIPEQQSPESWATASVYQFAYDLSRLVAEATRRALFSAIRSEYRTGKRHAAPALLDSPLRGGRDSSLLRTLDDCVIEPLRNASRDVRKGRALPLRVPASIVLYGPPGTGKTTLARWIASEVGWPLATINPSHVIGLGADGVKEGADAVLGLVSRAEAVVALLDEFDELMRDRAKNGPVSRFLTTAMLSKLATINASRRVVLIVATNHLDLFDPAITRPGRFDALIPVRAPSIDEKMALRDPRDRLSDWSKIAPWVDYVRWDERIPQVARWLDASEANPDRFWLENLTYAEYDRFARDVVARQSAGLRLGEQEVGEILEDRWNASASGQYFCERGGRRPSGQFAALERLIEASRLPHVPSD